MPIKPDFKLNSKVKVRSSHHQFEVVTMKIIQIDHKHEIALLEDEIGNRQYTRFGMMELLPDRHLSIVK